MPLKKQFFQESTEWLRRNTPNQIFDAQNYMFQSHHLQYENWHMLEIYFWYSQRSMAK